MKQKYFPLNTMLVHTKHIRPINRKNLLKAATNHKTTNKQDIPIQTTKTDINTHSNGNIRH